MPTSICMRKNVKYYDCFKVILAILENVRIHRCSYLHSFTMFPDTNRNILKTFCFPSIHLIYWTLSWQKYKTSIYGFFHLNVIHIYLVVVNSILIKTLFLDAMLCIKFLWNSLELLLTRTLDFLCSFDCVLPASVDSPVCSWLPGPWEKLRMFDAWCLRRQTG